jgi:hypothetical protein
MGHLPATTRRYSPSLMRANVIVFYPFSCSNVKTIFRVPGPETPAPLCIAKRHKRSDTKFTLPQQFTPPQHQTYDKTTTYYNSRWIKPDHTMREQHNFSPLAPGHPRQIESDSLRPPSRPFEDIESILEASQIFHRR